MSFLKKFFDKVDEKKYGKGHRLGDAQAAQRELEQRYAQSQQSQAASNRPTTAAARNNEASLAAGQAALARIQQQQQKKQTPIQRIVSKELEEEEKKLKEAEKLKEHYFGTSHQRSIDKSSHITGNKISVNFKSQLLADHISLPLEEIELRIEDKLFDNLNNEPILTAVSLLLTANYRQYEKLDKCLEILNKLVDNIIANPTEEKYRKIRVENAQIKEKLLSLKYSSLVLETIGFKLKQCKKADDEESEEPCYIFDYVDETSIEKLNDYKESLKIAQPIKPELDRNIKLFKLEQQNHEQLANKFDLSEQFYNLNIEDIKREQKLREEALEKSGMLRTKAMRERDEQLELRKYNYCLIRVKFPNDYYIQTLFKSHETLQQIYLVVQSCLADQTIEFDLFAHVIQSKLSNNNVTKDDLMQQTLAEIGLAPATVLYFKCLDQNKTAKSIDYFTPELINNIKSSFN